LKALETTPPIMFKLKTEEYKILHSVFSSTMINKKNFYKNIFVDSNYEKFLEKFTAFFEKSPYYHETIRFLETFKSFRETIKERLRQAYEDLYVECGGDFKKLGEFYNKTKNNTSYLFGLFEYLKASEEKREEVLAQITDAFFDRELNMLMNIFNEQNKFGEILLKIGD